MCDRDVAGLEAGRLGERRTHVRTRLDVVDLGGDAQHTCAVGVVAAWNFAPSPASNSASTGRRRCVRSTCDCTVQVEPPSNSRLSCSPE